MKNVHDFFSENRRGDFFFTGLPEVPLEIIHIFFDEVHADITLLAGFLESGAYLTAIEYLSSPVLFDDHDGNVLDVLVGGESPVAHETLSTPANDISILAYSRINNFVVNFATKWTLHNSPLYVVPVRPSDVELNNSDTRLCQHLFGHGVCIAR